MKIVVEKFGISELSTLWMAEELRTEIHDPRGINVQRQQ